MSINVIDITHYPVKGMTGARLNETVLQPGRGVPGDRRFGIARGGGGAGAPSFLGLTRHARLATLTAAFDEASECLTISRQGRPVARGDITTPAGRATIEQFFSAYMAKELSGPARLMDATTDPAYSDPAHRIVSIINLASVRDLERVIGEPVDPRRFRGNFYIDGIPAWSENDWVGQTVQIGEATLRVDERTERCAATNVNLETAARDLNIPLALRRGFGHMDLGVYATVVEGGLVAAGS